MRVLGVDACRAGWVGIELAGGTFARAGIAATLAGLLAALRPGGEPAAVGVDIPLGLVPSGWRDADLEAARLLGPRRGSVFRVPPLPVWQEPDFAAANRRCRELTPGGSGLSMQAWRLRQKLTEANALRDAGGVPLYEVHPELSFRALAGAPLPYSKKTWAGQCARRELLAAAGIVVPAEPGPAGLAGPDDVLDAAAAAWTAQRVARGEAVRVPVTSQRDGAGHPIAIWY